MSNRFYGSSTMNVTGFLTDWKTNNGVEISDKFKVLSIAEQFRSGYTQDAKNESLFHSILVSGDVLERLLKVLKGSSPKGYLINAVLGEPNMNVVSAKDQNDKDQNDKYTKYVSWKLLTFSLVGGGKKKDGTNSDEPSAPKSKPADRSPAFDDDIPF